MIWRQGMSGFRLVTLSDSRAAASPMIWTRCTSASWTYSSRMKASWPSDTLMAILCAASRMSASRSSHGYRFGDDPVPHARLEPVLGGDLREDAEQGLHIQCEAGHVEVSVAWCHVDQQVQVAV